MSLINRVYHPYHLWEDYKAGMWRETTPEEHDHYLSLAVAFTGDTELYGKWMLTAIEQWPYACEHNLTCSSMNRQAWIGHAACCLAINCPEHITREAWWKLTDEQRTNANLKADYAIAKWEQRYLKGLTGKCQQNGHWEQMCLMPLENA